MTTSTGIHTTTFADRFTPFVTTGRQAIGRHGRAIYQRTVSRIMKRHAPIFGNKRAAIVQNTVYCGTQKSRHTNRIYRRSNPTHSEPDHFYNMQIQCNGETFFLFLFHMKKDMTYKVVIIPRTRGLFCPHIQL